MSFSSDFLHRKSGNARKFRFEANRFENFLRKKPEYRGKDKWTRKYGSDYAIIKPYCELQTLDSKIIHFCCRFL